MIESFVNLTGKHLPRLASKANERLINPDSPYVPVNHWSEEKRTFGQNDYIGKYQLFYLLH